MSTVDLDILTAQLRAIRLPDESAVLLTVGSVTATKEGHTATVKAVRLEDALLMVRARLDEAIKREAAEREAAKAEKGGAQ